MRIWLLSTVVLSLGCASAPADTGEVPPELELRGVGFRLYRGDLTRAVGKADAVTFHRDRGDVSAEHAVVEMRGRTPDGDLRLFASEADGNVDRKAADGRRGVRLSDARGTVGATPTAHFDGTAEKATGLDPVDVVGNGFSLRAQSGFELSMPEGGHLELHGPVTTHAQLQEAP